MYACPDLILSEALPYSYCWTQDNDVDKLLFWSIMATFDGNILQHNKSHCRETQTWDVSGQILPEEMGDKSEKGSSAQRNY